MRSITTDWNNASYADAASFTDVGGAVLSIAAGNPEKCRAMADSIAGGDWQAGELTGFEALPATATKAPEATQVVAVTLLATATPMAGIIVTAVSSDVAKATVSPAWIKTGADGVASFTVTAVATGEATVTFATKNGAFSDTLVLTVS